MGLDEEILNCINNEKDFEEYLRKEIQEKIIDKNKNLYLLKSKGIFDITIIKDNCKVFNLELKVNVDNRNGYVGLTGKTEKHIQIESLINDIPYFDKYLKWIVLDKPNNKLILACNSVVKKFPTKDKETKKYEFRAGKTNNIKGDIFSNQTDLTINNLIKKLQSWIDDN